MKKWYCVQIKEGQYTLAGRELEKQGFEWFCPFYKEKIGLMFRVRALFPGYMFVRFDTEVVGWRSVNGTRGVRRLMCMDSEKPSPVKDALIEELGKLELVEGLEEVNVFEEGMKAEVLEGPLKGHIGIVQYSGKNRIKLLFDLLGGKTMISIIPKFLKNAPLR